MDASPITSRAHAKVKNGRLGGEQTTAIRRVFFELLCYLSQSKSHFKQLSQRRAVLRHSLPLLFVTLNELAFLPLKPLSDYTGTARVWKGLLWLRLDYIVTQLHAVSSLIHVIWILHLCFAVTLLTTVTLIVLNHPPSPRLKQFFSLSASLVYVVLKVPVMHVLLADCVRQEHAGELAVATNTLIPGISVLAVGLMMLTVLIKETAALEVLLHPRYWLPGRSASILPSFISLCSLCASSLLYLVLPPFSHFIFYGLFSTFHGVLAILYFSRLPFYSELSNFLHISSHLSLCWGGVALVTSELVDSDLVGVALVALVTPVLCYTLHSVWPSLYKQTITRHYNNSRLPQSTSCIFLALREAISACDTPSIIQTFRNFRLNSPQKEAWIGTLEASWYLQVKGDERTARLKLACNLESRSRLGYVNSFFRYKLWRSLAHSTLEEVIYLRFLNNIAQVNSTDEDLCRNLANFWSELASQVPNHGKLNRLIDSISVQIHHSKTLYQHMLQGSSDNPALLDSYTGFLRDILLQSATADEWDTKARIAREAQLKAGEGEVKFGQEGTGVLVVDMGANAGTILYCNEEAAELLQFDVDSLAFQKLHSLLPPPFSVEHLTYFLRCNALNSVASLSHPELLSLYTARGYLLEMSTKSVFTCVGGSLLLLFGFRKASMKREIALVTSEGYITATSQGFPRLLGVKRDQMTGVPLSEVCERFSLDTEEVVMVRKKPAIYGCVNRVRYGSKDVLVAALFAGSSADYLKVIAEVRRRSSVEKVMYRSLLYSSTQSLDKTEPLNAYRPPSSLNSRVSGRPHKSLELSTSSSKLPATGQLVLNVKKGINREYTVLVSVAVLIALLTIVWTIAISMYLVTVTNGVIDDSVTVQLSERVVHTTRLAGQGRFLDLTNAGFFSEYMTTDVKNVISQSITLLSDIEAVMWERLKSVPDSAFKTLMLDAQFPTWELSGNTSHIHTRNLVNAMSVYLDHSKMLLDLPLSSLSVHNPSVFFVVRNGMKGELIDALAKSLTLFADIEKRRIEEDVSNILYLLISVFVCLGVALLVSIPVITRLQMHIGAISNLFMNIPLAVCIENRQRVVDRLKVSFGVEVESSLETPRKLAISYVIYRPIWKLVALVLGFLGVSVVLYMVMYFSQIAALTDYVGYLPKVMGLYAKRFMGIIDLWTWTVEAIFSTSTWPLSLAIPNSSLQLSPKQELALTRAYLARISKELFFLAQDGYLPYSPHNLDLFLKATNYTSPILKKGLRPGLIAYSMDIGNCAQYRGVSDDMYTDCGNLYSAARELVNVSSDFLGIVQEDFKAESLSRGWWINYWLLSWAGFSLVFLSVGVLPLLYRSRRHVLRMILMSKLIPEPGASRETSTHV